MQRIPSKWHIVFWMSLIVVSVAALSPYYMNLFKAIIHRVIFLPVWIIATYGNLYLLLPKLWDRGRRWQYAIAITFFILALTIMQRIVCIEYFYPTYFWMRAPNADEINPFWLGPFIQFSAFISLPVILSTGIREALRWYQESYKSKQIIAAQQTAELNYLKAQVNPHFLFNTLNNLYGLSLESSNKVPSMILKLSDLLSYSLYESKVDTVTIEKELALIRDFIALETTRYEDRVLVNIDVEKGVNLKRRIAPLMMLPLVENAFKHGVKNTEGHQPIEISLHQNGDLFTFSIKNNQPTLKVKTPESQGGIGIPNLRRRLSLHYPDCHKLTIHDEQDTFLVNLQLSLDV